MKLPMNKEQLNRILELHALWLESEGDYGKAANFDAANLREVNLSGVDLTNASFQKTNLKGVNLDGANLEEAILSEANLTDAYLKKANLHRASLWKANLNGANLENAILTEADLIYTTMKGANFYNANLAHAVLQKANLERANLYNAVLYEADISEAKLNNANLTGAELGFADLSYSSIQKANLHRANLHNANMFGVDLGKANLNSVSLHEAILKEAILDDADMRGAIMSKANLFDADLIRANLRGANLEDANLQYANLQNADLRDVNLKNADLEGAKLEGVNFKSANLKGANLASTILELIITGKRTATGAKRRVVKALQKVAGPMQIAAFKRAFPEAFETIKKDLPGGILDPERAAKLIDKYGFVWSVTKTIWKSKLQRLSEKPNDVLQLNIDLALLTDDSRLLATIEAIRKTSYHSAHPVLKTGLFTIGWVRYSRFDNHDVLLIEEVQSDLPIVRKGLDDSEFQMGLKQQGLTDEQILAALDLLEPFVSRFYQDALSLIFDVAEELGLWVEMLTFEIKNKMRGFGTKDPPESVYERLPKSMGMRKTTEVKSPINVIRLWQITPNPPRNRSGKIPEKFAWRSSR